MTLDIIIDMDQVKIESTTVMRPTRMGRSEWLNIWECIQETLDKKRERK
jgi:hypothetical protein